MVEAHNHITFQKLKAILASNNINDPAGTMSTIAARAC